MRSLQPRGAAAVWIILDEAGGGHTDRDSSVPPPPPPSCCRLGSNNEEDTEVGGGRSDSETVENEGFGPSSTDGGWDGGKKGPGPDLRSCRGLGPRSGSKSQQEEELPPAPAHVLSCCWRSASGQAGALLVKDGCKNGCMETEGKWGGSARGKMGSDGTTCPPISPAPGTAGSDSQS